MKVSSANLSARKKTRYNFTSFETHIFNKIWDNNQVVFALADKGLGPVAIELERYIQDRLKHLLDSKTYKIIQEEQSLAESEDLCKEIYSWTFQFRKLLTDQSVNCIQKRLDETNLDPFGYFYLLYKSHKTPLSTRPVCSDCVSLPRALGE